MFHSKQWHYSLHRDFQQLHSTHSTWRNPRDSSSTNSSSRRQKALRLILHTGGKEIFYPVYKRPYKDISGIPATRPSTGIPVLQWHSRHSWHSAFRHYYMFQHTPVCSNTFQYIPVCSSAIQYLPVHPGIPPHYSILQLECIFYTSTGFH